MSLPQAFATADRATILRALTTSQWNVTQAAAQLNVPASTLLYRMTRLGIQRPSKPAPRVERHPPTATIVAELDQLRLQARLLFRAYGCCPHRTQELLRIEARHRYLRGLLRRGLGDAEATETRERSLAGFGLAKGTRATWTGQR